MFILVAQSSRSRPGAAILTGSRQCLRMMMSQQSNFAGPPPQDTSSICRAHIQPAFQRSVLVPSGTMVFSGKKSAQPACGSCSFGTTPLLIIFVRFDYISGPFDRPNSGPFTLCHASESNRFCYRPQPLRIFSVY
jgi:hypothetical protein